MCLCSTFAYNRKETFPFQDAAFASFISMLQSPLFNQLLSIQKSAADQNAEELQYANEDFAPKPESKLPLWLNGPVSEDHSPKEPKETTAGIEKEPTVEAAPKTKFTKEEFKEKLNRLAQGKDYEIIDLFKGKLSFEGKLLEGVYRVLSESRTIRAPRRN